MEKSGNNASKSLWLWKSPLWIWLGRILCWLWPGCLSPVCFGGKVTNHLATCDPHGWTPPLEVTLLINQPALGNRLPELWGDVVIRQKRGRSLWGGAMTTSVPDGWSEAGSGCYQWRTALKSVGFSCGAWSKVCQWPSSCPRQKWIQSAHGHRQSPRSLEQEHSCDSCTGHASLRSLTSSPQSPQMKYEEWGREFPKPNREPFHRCLFRNRVEIEVLQPGEF